MNEARLRKTAWRYVRERGSAHPTIKTLASVYSVLASMSTVSDRG